MLVRCSNKIVLARILTPWSPITVNLDVLRANCGFEGALVYVSFLRLTRASMLNKRLCNALVIGLDDAAFQPLLCDYFHPIDPTQYQLILTAFVMPSFTC